MITREDVLKMAKLARLYVDEEEIGTLTRDMAEIIQFADTVRAEAGDTVSDASAPEEGEGTVNAFHEDEVIESFDRELILRNRDGGEDGYFVVKKRGGR
jgi:aspartyl/glutamyl-tRNA(Asn/Gln) amidotransferase C subunit